MLAGSVSAFSPFSFAVDNDSTSSSRRSSSFSLVKTWLRSYLVGEGLVRNGEDPALRKFGASQARNRTNKLAAKNNVAFRFIEVPPW